MAVTVGPIGSAPAPGSTPIGDRRVDLTTGTVWRNDGERWNADERIRDDVLAAVLAEPTSLTHAAAGSAVPAATESAPGKVELATAAETATGTDTTRAVHPAGLKPLLGIRSSRQTRTGGDITLNQTAFTAIDTALDLTLPAVAGDTIEVNVNTILGPSTDPAASNHVNMTAYTRVSGADVNNIAGGTGSAPAWFAPEGLVTVSGSQLYVVQAGDLSAGNVTVRVYYKINGSSFPRTLFANSGNPTQVAMKNLR